MAHPFAILIRRIIWILVALTLILFAVSNRHIVEISLLPFQYAVTIPVWGVLFLGIFIGLLISAFVTGWFRLKSFTKRRKAERRVDELDAQVNALAEDTHKLKAAKAHEEASGGLLTKND